MNLYVNKLERFDIGGTTSNLGLIITNLEKLGLSKEDIIKGVHPNTIQPSIIGSAGRFIFILKFDRAFTQATLWFINSNVNTVKCVKSLAKNLSTQAILHFKQIKSKIERENPDNIMPVFLLLASSNN